MKGLRAQHLKYLFAGSMVFSILGGILIWSTTRSRTQAGNPRPASVSSKPVGKLDKNNQASRDSRESASKGEPGNMDEMTPDKASMLMEQAQGILDMEKRAIHCAGIIEHLCAGGYTREAWELINANPGQVRDYEINAFFKSASLNDEELVGKLTSLESRFDFANGFSSYFDRYDLQQTRDFVLGSRFSDLIGSVKNHLEANTISNVLDGILQRESIFANSDKQSQVLALASDLYSRNLIGKSVVLRAYGRDQSLDVFSRWDAVSKLAGDISKDHDSTVAVNQVIKDMIKSDANRAAISLTSVNGDFGLDCLHAGIKEWAVIDSAAANKWFLENENKLPGPQRDAAAASFFKVSLDFGDKVVAKQWLDQICDPDLRETALNMLQRE